MATDITTLLIQMITEGSTQATGAAVQRAALGSAADLLSLTANYAQILGTAAPAAQIIANEIVREIAVAFAESEKEAAAITAAASTSTIINPAVGGVVVLIMSVIAGILTMLGDSGQSSQSQQLQDIYTALLTGR